MQWQFPREHWQTVHQRTEAWAWRETGMGPSQRLDPFEQHWLNPGGKEKLSLKMGIFLFLLMQSCDDYETPFSLNPLFSKCSAVTRSICITLGLVRNADSRALPQTCWLGGGTWGHQSVSYKSSRWPGSKFACSNLRSHSATLLDIRK